MEDTDEQQRTFLGDNLCFSNNSHAFPDDKVWNNELVMGYSKGNLAYDGEIMALFNLKKFGKYSIQVVCENCGKPCEVRIKKGVTVQEAIHAKSLTCDNCGVVIEPKEYKTQWFK